MRHLARLGLLALLALAGSLGAEAAAASTIGTSKTFTDTNSKLTFSTTAFPEIIKYSYFADSTSMLLLDADNKVWASNSEGTTWKPAPSITEPIKDLLFHPFDPKTAVAVGEGTVHYYTRDAGATFQQLNAAYPAADPQGDPIVFNSANANSFIYHGKVCDTGKANVCHIEAFRATFNSGISTTPIAKYVNMCLFANMGTLHVQKDAVYCAKHVKESGNQKLAPSANDRVDFMLYVPSQPGQSLLTGINGFSVLDKFVVVASERTDMRSLQLLVSTDGEGFSEVDFPLDTEVPEAGYYILASKLDYLIVDVVTDLTKKMSTLFTSDSSGQMMAAAAQNIHFALTDGSIVPDLEEAQLLDGYIFINERVQTASNLIDGGAKLRTRLSKDGGGYFDYIDGPKEQCPPSSKNCWLHLHGPSTISNVGSLYSNPSIPGYFIGVGNVGDHLLDLDAADTYLSTDGGDTWKLIAEGPHLHEFADRGSFVVLVPMGEFNKTVLWSTDMTTFTPLALDVPIKAIEVTAEPKSSTQKIMIRGTVSSSNGGGERTIVIDFDPLNLDMCDPKKAKQWDTFPPSVDNENCILGTVKSFQRRRPDAGCAVGADYQDVAQKETICECTLKDFECDMNYLRTGLSSCEYDGDAPIPACVNGFVTKPTGFRKIPEDKCNLVKGSDVDKVVTPTKTACTIDTTHPSPSPSRKPYSNNPVGSDREDTISANLTPFSRRITNFFYVGNSDSMNPETIFVLSEDGKVSRSVDGGVTFFELDGYTNIVSMIAHEHDKKRLYLLSSTKMYASSNGGVSFRTIDLPARANSGMRLHVRTLDFHPKRPEYVIFIGYQDCTGYDPKLICHTEAYYTFNIDAAKVEWKLIDSLVEQALWGQDENFIPDYEAGIIYSAYPDKTKPQPQNIWGTAAQDQLLNLILLKDPAKGEKTVLFQDIEVFAVFANYMAVALKKNNDLELHVSLDAEKFDVAVFPDEIGTRQAYTILESSQKSIFLGVFVEDLEGITNPSSTIYVSDSSGTKFTKAISGVHRSDLGYVDFEKMQGMEGIIIVNIFADFDPENAPLVSKISFDDGSEWRKLKVSDACSGISCNLHLHSVTERRNSGRVFSTASAVGLMVGVGNTGLELLPYAQGSTFITRDGGFTWKKVVDVPTLYEFGNAGGVILFVPDNGDGEATDTIYYSTDEGATVNKLRLAEKFVPRSVVADPDSLSTRFLIIGWDSILQIDFQKVFPRACTDNDFVVWDAPNSDSCVLGRMLSLNRRKPASNCYLTKDKHDTLAPTVTPCACSDADFECDYDYVRTTNQSMCIPKPNYTPAAWDCAAGDVHYVSSGYHKIPGDQCKGGVDLEKMVLVSCTNPTRGLTGTTIAAIVLVPIAVAGLGFFVWRYVQKSGFSFADFRLPNFMSHVRYSRLSQSDTEVLMDDY